MFENKNTMLHKAIRANALFCDVSGLAMTFAAKPIAQFIGLENSTALVFIGIGLVGWSVFLFMTSMQVEIPKWKAWLAIEGDLAWVIGSAVVLLGDFQPLTMVGKWTIGTIADLVMGFAIWQFWSLRKMKSALSSG